MEQALTSCPLFKGVSPSEITHLFDNIEYKIILYKKNEIVVNEGDTCKNLYIIISGSVRGEMTDFSGKIIKIEDIGALRPLAPAFLFGMNNRFPVSIITNEDVEITSVSKEMVLQMFKLNHLFLINFLNMISNRAQFLSHKIKFLSFQTIKEKLAHYLLQFDINKESKNFKLSVSQQQLSELFGVTRPSLGRAIRELDNEGYISADGKNIKIVDHEKLSGLLKKNVN